jgi:hypothetical protein
MKCENCLSENPAGRIFCEKCGHKLVLRPNSDPSREEVNVLLEKIEALQRELLARQTEIESLQNEVNRVSKERDEMVGNQPELKATLHKLDEKEMQLEAALPELDALRKELREITKPHPGPEPRGSGAQLVIKSHPIKRSNFDVTLANDQQSLDLSTTEFHIRANLERTPKGFDLLVHDGASINVQAPGSKRWKRYAGGARLSADPGMVLFDNKGLMNALLEWSI